MDEKRSVFGCWLLFYRPLLYMSYLDQARHFIWAQTYYNAISRRRYILQAFNQECVTKNNFLKQNLYCGYSKEPSQWDGSFEHPKHKLKLMGKKILTIIRSKLCLSKPIIRSRWLWTEWRNITLILSSSEGSYESAHGHILARTLTALKRDRNGHWNKI